MKPASCSISTTSSRFVMIHRITCAFLPARPIATRVALHVLLFTRLQHKPRLDPIFHTLPDALLTFNHLPSANVKVLLTEECDHDRTVCELPASQRGQCFLRGRRLFVFDVDLANTGSLPATSGSGHLGVENLAVLSALFLDVVENFWA